MQCISPLYPQRLLWVTWHSSGCCGSAQATGPMTKPPLPVRLFSVGCCSLSSSSLSLILSAIRWTSFCGPSRSSLAGAMASSNSMQWLRLTRYVHLFIQVSLHRTLVLFHGAHVQIPLTCRHRLASWVQAHLTRCLSPCRIRTDMPPLTDNLGQPRRS